MAKLNQPTTAISGHFFNTISAEPTLEALKAPKSV